MSDTPAMWKQRDGTLIAVTEMGDRHLMNTIEMLKRASEVQRLHDVMRYDRYVATAPDGAADCATMEATAIAESTNAADYFPIYSALVAEAAARKLAINPDAITIYQTTTETA